MSLSPWRVSLIKNFLPKLNCLKKKIIGLPKKKGRKLIFFFHILKRYLLHINLSGIKKSIYLTWGVLMASFFSNKYNSTLAAKWPILEV